VVCRVGAGKMRAARAARRGRRGQEAAAAARQWRVYARLGLGTLDDDVGVARAVRDTSRFVRANVVVSHHQHKGQQNRLV